MYGSMPTVRNCVLWGNAASWRGSEIDVTPLSVLTVIYSNVASGAEAVGGSGIVVWGEGNISADPLFVPGPRGCYYLSQIGAGQPASSPCVDAGSNTAADLYLDTLTTRSDEVTDAGLVDMGYHYPVTGMTLVMGDYDRSGRVDLLDVAGLQNCYAGRGPLSVPPCCRIFDFEPDEDVDIDDFVALKHVFAGP